MTEFERAAERFQEGLIEMLGVDSDAALSVVTGTFVSLTLEVVQRNGYDTSGQIRVDGGDNRDVTIHAPKDPAAIAQQRGSGEGGA